MRTYTHTNTHTKTQTPTPTHTQYTYACAYAFTHTLQDTIFSQLAVRLANNPNYLFCHLGCCEHLVEVSYSEWCLFK